MRNENGTEDYFGECFTPRSKMSGEAFDKAYCIVCKNAICVRAGWGVSQWADRMNTQVDRLLNNPNFADPRDPRFNHVREHDFPSLLREAITIEIVDSRNDWTIPTNQDIQDKLVGDSIVHSLKDSSEKESSTTSEQNSPSGSAGKTPSQNPVFQPEVPAQFKGVSDSEKPTSQIKSIKQEPQNPFINTPFPKDGLMVDGTAPAELQKSLPKGDSWDVPAQTQKPKNIVKKGARIQMGASKKSDK